MKIEKLLWAIEEFSDGKWCLLPNTVQVRRLHCESDVRWMREEAVNSKFRIVKYERQKARGEQ